MYKRQIWIKYKQYHLSALLDTGSDVTIAGEDVAEKMGWRIVEQYQTGESGKQRANVHIRSRVRRLDHWESNRQVRDPDNTKPQRSDPRDRLAPPARILPMGLRQGSNPIGQEDWIELCQEKRSIRRIRPVLSDLNEDSDSTLESNYVPVRRSDQELSLIHI